VHKVAIPEYGFWERRFGSDRALVGRTIKLDRDNVTVVGVLAGGFGFGGYLHAQQHGSRRRGCALCGRVWTAQAGCSAGTAQTEIDAVSRRLADLYPGMKGRGIRL
jgi:hypothetical protein